MSNLMNGCAISIKHLPTYRSFVEVVIKILIPFVIVQSDPAVVCYREIRCKGRRSGRWGNRCYAIYGCYG